MSQWRNEMMRHIKPRKQVNVEEQEQKQRNRTRIKRIMEAHRAHSEKVILKVRTSPSSIKNKLKLNLQSASANRQSERNLIVIRPTLVEENQINISKTINRSKRILSKNSRQIIFDNNREQQRQNIFDELALQRLASFQALLPYLGTQKAKVEEKPQRKEKLVKFDLEPSRKKPAQKVQDPEKVQMNNISIKIPDKITGWDIED